MKKAALHNLGCKVNAYETEAMQQMLEEAGYEIVPFSEKADVYVINTCSVTNMADRKSRQMLHRAKKRNPDAAVVAAGCYVQTKEDEAKCDEAIDILIGNNQKKELVERLDAFFAGRGEKVEAVVDINHEKQAFEELTLDHAAEHTRACIYQGAGWLQPVLQLLHYSVCQRTGEKQKCSECSGGSKASGSVRISGSGTDRNSFKLLRD